ncbi:YjbH domain-containing protein [Roseomonas frigidaquae]|uniref:YjbH domain-containing protein n=1 Tax=Falsiroseomonas frigidaquae TaxID=487318 RepID=A0ABX1EX70_9PROT|nr:YjbH domain-containing protein [Falsiroseomonas frigidaquae]
MQGGQRPSCKSRRAALALTLFLPATAVAQEVPGTGSSYGGVGLIEMRNARFRPDGVVEAGSSLRHQRRFHFLNWQALPWLETSFRLAERLDGTSGAGMTTDRSFDVKLRLLTESDWVPAVAVGLQDFIGTGLYSGEYVVASKRFGNWDATLGIGWGRLGTGDDLGNPLTSLSPRFEDRPRDVGEGGSINTFPFFRGEQAAVFGGLEYSLPELWTPFGGIEGLRAKVEYSGDALRDERGGWPARTTGLRGEARSRLNYGLHWSNGWLDAGLDWVHGTDLLFRLSARFDPDRVPERAALPALGARPVSPPAPEAAMREALRRAGFRPVAVEIAGAEARIAVAGGRQRRLAGAAGRVLRAVQPHLPRGFERLRLSWRQAGVEVARLTLPRRAMEAASRGDGSAEELFFASTLEPAGADRFGLMGGGSGFAWGAEPRLSVLLGDPSRTLRWQAAAVLGARWEIGQGFAVAGSLSRALAGNLAGAPPSDSLLPRVRSEAARYAREGETAIPALYGEGIWGLGPDLFGRVTAGYLEPMFAGVSAEVLWRPHDRPWALGVDVAQVAQRDYDQQLGVLGYHVTTGHVSAYADLPWHNLQGVVRAGRYLAGDWGATVELSRRFASGIEIGGFATLTDVPFSQFGEGSFDRGIFIRIPLDLFGIETRAVAPVVVRGVTRDGGARLAVDNPLWEVTREGRSQALQDGFRDFLR